MGKFKKTRRRNVRRHNKSRRVQTGGNGVNYTEKIIQKELDLPKDINVYFGDLLHVKPEELDKLYIGLKNDIAPFLPMRLASH